MIATVICGDARTLPPGRYSTIMARLIITPNGCWQWTGTRDRRGYGRAAYGPRRLGIGLVHRIVWEHLNGPVPAGLELDHLCRNPSCANPAHLEAVSHRENVKRGIAPVLLAARNAAVTHCPKGHEYDETNTYMPPGKRGRECRICRNAATRAWKAARR